MAVPSAVESCALTVPCASTVPLDPVATTFSRQSKVNCPLVEAASAAVVTVNNVTVPSLMAMVVVGVPVDTVKITMPETRSARPTFPKAPARKARLIKVCAVVIAVSAVCAGRSESEVSREHSLPPRSTFASSPLGPNVFFLNIFCSSVPRLSPHDKLRIPSGSLQFRGGGFRPLVIAGVDTLSYLGGQVHRIAGQD